MVDVVIATAIEQFQGASNLLRAHADLGDYLPPKVSRSLADMLQAAVNDLSAGLAHLAD